MTFKPFQQLLLAMGTLCLPIAVQADEAKKPQATAEASKPSAPKKKSREDLFAQGYLDKLSQTYGHMIQKSLNNPVIKLNPKEVIQGIQDAQAGKSAPLTEKEYEESLNLIQQYGYEDMANKNLSEAETYLAKNATEAGVVQLEGGKIQYKILQPGSGETVTEETMPTINYSATYSNGQKLGSSEQTGGPIDVNLDETIPGFHKGILGMKVGEKRQIFIHPDMGYGKSGQLPNGLLIFEIEVTKVQPKPVKPAGVEDEDDLSDSDDMLETSDDDDESDDESPEVDEEDADYMDTR